MTERILVVDDDVRVLSSFSRNLTYEGYEVMLAGGGEAGIDMYARERPDIVLVDVRMPPPDGFAVLKAIREQAPDAEVIMVTGHGDIDIAVEALRLGASDFLCKPVDGSELEVALKRSRERLRLKRELYAAREEAQRYAVELERSNEELERFAYIASHDLRQPLRLVSGYVYLLGQRYKDQLDETAHEFIDYAIEGVTRMDRLITDLLTYSRVGRGTEGLALIDCDDVLDQALVILRPSIEESRALVTRDPLPTLVADATQLLQLFQNLIDNAIKFQPAERLEPTSDTPPQVHVSAERRGDEWLFSVRDNGIGIDPKDGERIFAAFDRLHSHSEYAGSGIGLAICKKVVENHGGSIGMTSQLDEGATFYFTIPSVLFSK